MRDIFVFFNRRCFHDDIYNLFISRPLLTLSLVSRRNFENGILAMFSITASDFVYEYRLLNEIHGRDAVEDMQINAVLFALSVYFLFFL